ncbi:LysR substrate-binding domain-containing protein [Scytonema sp. PRP1]|uniref:LysR substrate-binding domain-containing protein n=1 Tax=Scytonema sp. PRP1 TaxID=3120513 RepID=UPI002FD04EB5
MCICSSNLGLVSAGLGVSLAPASIRNIHRTGVVYITLNTLNAEVELVAAWRQDEPLPVLQTFLEVMKKVVSQNSCEDAAQDTI